MMQTFTQKINTIPLKAWHCLKKLIHYMFYILCIQFNQYSLVFQFQQQYLFFPVYNAFFYLFIIVPNVDWHFIFRNRHTFQLNHLSKQLHSLKILRLFFTCKTTHVSRPNCFHVFNFFFFLIFSHSSICLVLYQFLHISMR